MADARMGYGPFPAQVEFFRRKLNVPSARWDDLMHGDHAHGFMVAGLTRMTMLDEVRQAMMAAIQNGESYEKFRARFDKTLGKAWSTLRGGETEAGRAWRTRLIYQTNLRTSYMAGRWETLQKYPYLKYQHNTVDNPRESHQALDGKIIPTRDPWWDTHYPPNGWMCRCTVTGVSEARLRAMRGADAQPDEPPPTDPKDPPPEWAYHVGKASRSMAAAERFGQKVMQLPPAWRKAVLDDAQGRIVEWFKPSWTAQVNRSWAQIEAGRTLAVGESSPIGIFSEETVLAIERADGILPKSATINMSDRQIIHALRDAKDKRELVLGAVRSLPDWLNQSDTKIYRESEHVYHFAREIPGGSHVVAVLKLDHDQTRVKEPVNGAWVITLKVLKAIPSSYTRVK